MSWFIIELFCLWYFLRFNKALYVVNIDPFGEKSLRLSLTVNKWVCLFIITLMVGHNWFYSMLMLISFYVHPDVSLVGEFSVTITICL